MTRSFFHTVYCKIRLVLLYIYVIVLCSCCVGCSNQHKVENEVRSLPTIQLAVSDTEIHKECRKNICVQVRVLLREQLLRQQQQNVQKLQAMYSTNKELVGSAALRKRYEQGRVPDRMPDTTVDLLFTVIASAIDTNKPDHQYSEIAQKLETSLQEESWLSTGKQDRSTPSVVRIYEVHPVQNSWQILLTIPCSVMADKRYTLHWSDTVFGTGTYTIAL